MCPFARLRALPMRLTRPWRSRTAWMVLLAGTRTRRSRRRTKSSRDLAGTPMGLVVLEADDQAFDLRRELVGVAHGPPRPVGEGLGPVLLVAVENLVSGLAGDAELTGTHPSSASPSRRRATKRRRSSITELSFHGIAHLPPVKTGEKCHPCVRNESHLCLRPDMSPMSQAVRKHLRNHEILAMNSWSSLKPFNCLKRG